LVTDGIELDLGKAGGGEFRGELGLELGILKAGRFLRGNLDEGPCAKVPHADDAESVLANGLFGLFDGGESLGGDGEARGESGGQARGGRLFGNFQPGLPGEGTDIGLGEAGLPKRGGHGEFSGSGAARTDFPGVIKIFSIGENGDTPQAGELLHPLEKFRAAEVAAIRQVGGVGGVVQLQGFENFNRQGMFLGEGEGGGMFRAGETGGVAEDAGDPRTVDLVGRIEKKGGVDPTRVGDQGRRPEADEILQLLIFGFEIKAHGFDRS